MQVGAPDATRPQGGSTDSRLSSLTWTRNSWWVGVHVSHADRPTSAVRLPGHLPPTPPSVSGSPPPGKKEGTGGVCGPPSLASHHLPSPTAESASFRHSTSTQGMYRRVTNAFRLGRCTLGRQSHTLVSSWDQAPLFGQLSRNQPCSRGYTVGTSSEPPALRSKGLYRS